MQWLAENLGTIIVLLIVVAIAGIAALSVIKNRRKGGCSCGCGCSTCPMAGKCHASDEHPENNEK